MSGYRFTNITFASMTVTSGVIACLFISIIIGAGAGFGLAMIPNNWGDGFL